MSLIPGQRTKILHGAAKTKQKQNKKEKREQERNEDFWDFLGGLVVKSVSFQCSGFVPWLRNWDPTCCTPKNKRKLKTKSKDLEYTDGEASIPAKRLRPWTWKRAEWREETGKGGDSMNEARGCGRAFLGKANSLFSLFFFN